MVTFGYPDDYFTTFADQVNALNPEQIRDAGTSTVHADGLVWVIVGDRAKIEPGIRELNLGPVGIIDADGTVLTRTGTGTK